MEEILNHYIHFVLFSFYCIFTFFLFHFIFLLFYFILFFIFILFHSFYFYLISISFLFNIYSFFFHFIFIVSYCILFNLYFFFIYYVQHDHRQLTESCRYCPKSCFYVSHHAFTAANNDDASKKLSKYCGEVTSPVYKMSKHIGHIHRRRDILDSLLSNMVFLKPSERRDLVNNNFVLQILDFIPITVRHINKFSIIPNDDFPTQMKEFFQINKDILTLTVKMKP